MIQNRKILNKIVFNDLKYSQKKNSLIFVNIKKILIIIFILVLI